MEVLLEALVEANATLTAGAPVMGVNAGLFGFSALPLRLDPAARPGNRQGTST